MLCSMPFCGAEMHRLSGGREERKSVAEDGDGVESRGAHTRCWSG